MTKYDREFGMFMSEVWASMHWNDGHGQQTDWSDYAADYWLLNGRVYPDTLAPNGTGYDAASGNLLKTPGFEKLQYQPLSSLVTANSGDRVLLRFVNLGYTQAAMTLAGIPMRVIGKDATLLRGRDGTDLSYYTDTVYIGAGEASDAIFVAPPVTSPTTFLLYNRKLAQLANANGAGVGGQMTEVRVYPAGTLPSQTTPQT
jgi:FtsP/CotA-like multicopper oxidase with cupredoxin domain